MNLPFFIAQRIARNEQKSFSRFIIRLSIAATVISVAVMVVTLSFVNGFQETVSNKVFSFWGHIRVQYRQPQKTAISEEEPIAKNDTLLRRVQALPQVRSIHPFATKYAILKTPVEMEGVLLKGFENSQGLSNLEPFLKRGRWVQFNDSTYTREIVVSEYTANQLQLKLDDKVLIYFVRPDGSLRPDKLTITGIYKTGIEEYDKTFALADIKLIRRLNNWQEDDIGGYEIFLKDYNQMDDVSYAIYEQAYFPEFWETKTVREIYPNIFDWLGKLMAAIITMITIMVIIAAINFITCLIILVLERVRMIGTLKALGATDWTVQKIFLQHSLLITVSGIVLGLLIALGLLWIQQKTGFVHLDEDAYYMQTAVVKIDWQQIAMVAAGTLLVSVLVLLIPSFLVKKIQPIKAMRFS
jgi:lipoprotein-releasing system permease protein